MLPLQDAQVRLVLLNHVTLRLADAALDELHAAGIEMEQLAHLRQLSAVDLSRLAAMRSLTIGVTFDGAALRAGLRAVALVNEARALETYFIRHGASTHLMSALFKLRRKLTLKRRRDIGARRPAGRVRLPDYATRERIYQAWRAIADPSPRVRYYRLHQEFQHIPIAVLEAVVREQQCRLVRRTRPSVAREPRATPVAHPIRIGIPRSGSSPQRGCASPHGGGRLRNLYGVSP